MQLELRPGIFSPGRAARPFLEVLLTGTKTLSFRRIIGTVAFKRLKLHNSILGAV